MDGRVLPKEPGDPRRLGPYELLGRLGQGGMGVVYLGRERRRGRLAAVKALRPELAGDPGFAARFRREVEAARRIDSPRVARVLGAEPAGPRPWLATEYVDGSTLAAAVEAGGPLTGERLASFAVGVAEALAAIHAVGVVHRDLKPGNVLLEQSSPGGAGEQVKVIDFGIAWAADATMTRSGLRFGTPSWMAPERLRDRPAGPAADVFAWGALVAFAATGRHPFGGGPPEAVAYRVLHDPPDLAGVPGSLRPLVEAALARDPAARPTATRLVTTLAGMRSPTLPLPATAPTRVLPVAAALGPPPADPTRRRHGRRVGGAVVALALLAALVAAPQVVVAATGVEGNDPAAPAVAKLCPDDHEDERAEVRQREDDEWAAAEDEPEEKDEGDEHGSDEEQEEQEEPAWPEPAKQPEHDGPVPTDRRPAPPTTQPLPAPAAPQPPPTTAPTPSDPVLGS